MRYQTNDRLPMPSSTLTHREKSTDVQETYARHPRKAPDHDTVREVERVVEIGPPRDANFIARVEHIESSPQLQVHRAGEEHIPGVGEHVVGKAEAKKSGEVKQEREHGGAYDNREMHSWRGKIRVRADQKDTPGGKASGPPHQHEATDPCLSLSSDRSVTPPPPSTLFNVHLSFACGVARGQGCGRSRPKKGRTDVERAACGRTQPSGSAQECIERERLRTAAHSTSTEPGLVSHCWLSRGTSGQRQSVPPLQHKSTIS